MTFLIPVHRTLWVLLSSRKPSQGCFLLSFLSYPWHELVSPDITSLNLSPCPSESLGLPAFAPKFASPKFNTSPEAHQNSHHRLQLKNWIFVPHGYSTDLSSKHLTGYSQQPNNSRLLYPCWPMNYTGPWSCYTLWEIMMWNINMYLTVGGILLFWDHSFLSFVLKRSLTIVVTVALLGKVTLQSFRFLNHLHKNAIIRKTLKTQDDQIIYKHKILYLVCFHNGERSCRSGCQRDSPVIHHA